MRHITISVLSLFIVTPVMAGVRLPVVNIASGGVSARAAFGEDVASARPVTNVASVTPVAPAPTRTKKVVARTAQKTPASVTQTSVDSGAPLLATNDVLAPRRPSNDLWAKNDSGLRMPTPDEFAVYRSDSLLPEESLDSATRASSVSIANALPVAPRVAAPVAPAAEPMAEIDAQIARLTELQRRADASVRTVSPRVIAAPIAETKPAPAPVAEPVHVASTAPDVSLRRMVVPMTDDVVVRAVEQNKSPRIVAVRDDMAKMTPAQLRNAFRKTFLSENKHLSAYSIDDAFDVASDMSSSIEGFTAAHDISEGSGIRPLEIKIKFRNEDSALSRDNYNLLTEYAGIVVNKPTRAIQVAIPQYMTGSKDARKLAARRLAIVEQVLTDNGVPQQRIVPVLSNRTESGFVLRIISGEQYDSLTQQSYNMFGDQTSKKTYKSMSW